MARRLAAALVLSFTAQALPSANIYARQNSSECQTQGSYADVNNRKLPDPFTFADGTPVLSRADFTCRQAELSTMFQQFELGTYPGPPDSVDASMDGGNMDVQVTIGGQSVTISVTISVPDTAPGPAIINLGRTSSLPIPSNVGTISFDNDAFAAQLNPGSRGQGDFYTLFGSDHSAGAFTAWAWGVERVIDGLEQLGSETTGIDTTKLGVTGCSRNGRGALVIGALVDRIALTLPQESGAGGAASWRISDSEAAKGSSRIKPAVEIAAENVWFSTNFDSYASKVNTMPVDHHMLAGLVAPRGLYVIENDLDWLGPVSTTGSMGAARMIYQGLGLPNNMGFSLVGSHSHCQLPSSQQSELGAYINAFLLSGSEPGEVNHSRAKVNMADWVDWRVPDLS
ncbi:hypothetical protein DL770_010229 [Monosporascus sp. CRB-9-2]|nr:hypothetical protein DL770_010229 [Monosporascus sp. CRB-9-2]